MTRPALEAHDLFYRHAGRDEAAVDGVSLRLEAGEILAVVGGSGSGKSTLARVLLRLLAAQRGTIAVVGEVLYRAGAGAANPRGAALRALRRRIQIVFQQPGSTLDPRISIAEQVAEGPVAHRLWPAREGRSRARELLARVGLGDEHLDRIPEELSGGERQRAAIARALAVEPEILVLDEATAGLDAPLVGRFMSLVRELAGGGLACLVITHDLGLVADLAHRVAVYHHGRILETRDRPDLYGSTAHAYTKALLRAASGDRAWVAESTDPTAEGERG